MRIMIWNNKVLVKLDKRPYYKIYDIIQIQNTFTLLALYEVHMICLMTSFFLGSKCLFVLVILQITILNTIEKCTLVSAQQCVNAFCLCDCYMCFYVCVCVYSHVHTTYFTLVHFNFRLEQKDPWFYGNL